MKKSLFAMAALTAFASAAQAQSSVTVYGILDVGFVGSNTTVRSVGVENPTAPISYLGTDTSGRQINPRVGASASSANGFTGTGAETTSRIGFRGTEDLGGGTSAFFTVELAIAPQGEQAISTSATQNRQTFVGLKKNGIGAASIGTQYTPIHRALALTDPGQQNNVVGNVLYPNNTSGTFGVPGNGNTSSYTVRTNNMLFLESETLAGFKANAFYTQNNANSNQTTGASTTSVANSYSAGEGYRGGNNNQSGWGLGLNYTWQKLLVTANYQAFNSKNPYGAVTYTDSTLASSNAQTTTVTVAGMPGAWINASGGQNTKDNQQFYGATYDFGILKAYAGYINRKVSLQMDSSMYASRTAQQIGVRSFITPTIEAWASGGMGRAQSFGTSEPTANFNGWQLGTNYILSKRTNLYAIYGQTATGNVNVSSSVGSNGTAQATGGTISQNSSQYAVGLRHTF